MNKTKQVHNIKTMKQTQVILNLKASLTFNLQISPKFRKTHFLSPVNDDK